MTQDLRKFLSSAQHLVYLLRDLTNQDDFIGIPLLLKIIGETYYEKVRENDFESLKLTETLNFFDLYKEFVVRTVGIWRREKRFLSEEAKISLMKFQTLSSRFINGLP
jgi:hypothetical protein